MNGGKEGEERSEERERERERGRERGGGGEEVDKETDIRRDRLTREA